MRAVKRLVVDVLARQQQRVDRRIERDALELALRLSDPVSCTVYVDVRPVRAFVELVELAVAGEHETPTPFAIVMPSKSPFTTRSPSEKRFTNTPRR